jgi:aminopeptidase
MPNEMQRGFTELSKNYYQYANDKQLDFFPDKLLKGKVEQADHLLAILAEADKHELEGVSPQKIMRRTKAYAPYKDWRFTKEDQGKLTWTLALYGTEAEAKEAKMSLKEYWQQIIKACYLNEKDPVQKWREVYKEIDRIKDKLNSLNIKKLHLVSEDTDLYVGLGAYRKWSVFSFINVKL